MSGTGHRPRRVYGKGWLAFVTAIAAGDVIWDVIRHQYHGLWYLIPVYVVALCVAYVVNKIRERS